MEGEGRFEYNPEAAYYQELLDFLAFEMERSPETQPELRELQRYAFLMLQIIPPVLPEGARIEAVRGFSHELNRIVFPHLPPTLPPTTIPVGEHMSITPGYKAVHYWPDKLRHYITLKDGKTITKNTQIGSIDIVRNLGELAARGNFVTYTRKLRESTVDSLKETARLCEQNDPRFRGIEAFAGMSHLARTAGKFGFSVFEIEDPGKKQHATQVSRNVAHHVAGNNPAWQELQQNYKPAEIAFISKDLLVGIYGSQPTVDIRSLSR